MLQHCEDFELEDLEIGVSRILAWLTRSILGQQRVLIDGGSSVFETMHPREAYPGGALGYQKKTSSKPFPITWATFVNCTGFTDISGLSALKISPKAGGSKLKGDKRALVKGKHIMFRA